MNNTNLYFPIDDIRKRKIDKNSFGYTCVSKDGICCDVLILGNSKDDLKSILMTMFYYDLDKTITPFHNPEITKIIEMYDGKTIALDEELADKFVQMILRTLNNQFIKLEKYKITLENQTTGEIRSVYASEEQVKKLKMLKEKSSLLEKFKE